MARLARRSRAGELRGGGRGSGDDLGPERLLLDRVQNEAVAGAAVIPGVADEGMPVLNVGRRPGGEAFGAAGAMEGVGEESRGALAGGDHDSAAAQPCIERLKFGVHDSEFFARSLMPKDTPGMPRRAVRNKAGEL